MRQKEELTKIGYVRVSKQEQNEELQIDALNEAGCDKWFLDKMTRSKVERKGLDEALAYMRPGDTFMVWKLDRAGHLIELLMDLQGRGIEFISLTEQIDSTTPCGKLNFHLMGVLAEFERDLIRERTNAGLTAALDQQIGEMIRKHDFRFKDEARGTEMISWRRVAGFVAGEDK